MVIAAVIVVAVGSAAAAASDDAKYGRWRTPIEWRNKVSAYSFALVSDIGCSAIPTAYTIDCMMPLSILCRLTRVGVANRHHAPKAKLNGCV